MIGDLAMYGSCQVRINSSKLRGIAAPHYRFSCTDYSHEHPNEWGTLTSYQLLRPIAKATGQKEEDFAEKHSDLGTIDLSHDMGIKPLTSPFGDDHFA
jgi:hypothetical protein